VVDMASCVAIAVDSVTGAQYVTLDTITPLGSCSWVLFAQSDYTTFSGLGQLLATYLQFDPELFGYLVGSCLVTFITMFGVGKVLGAFRKV